MVWLWGLCRSSQDFGSSLFPNSRSLCPNYAVFHGLCGWLCHTPFGGHTDWSYWRSHWPQMCIVDVNAFDVLLLQLQYPFFFLMFLHLICFFDRAFLKMHVPEDVSNLSHWMFANLCPRWLALYGHVGSSPIVTRYCNWRGICKCFGVQHGTRSWQQKNHIWSSDAIWMLKKYCRIACLTCWRSFVFKAGVKVVSDLDWVCTTLASKRNWMWRNTCSEVHFCCSWNL